MAQLTIQDWAAFHALGDANSDGYIDKKDIAIIAAVIGTSEGSPNFNPAADINGDGVVNILDLIICEQNQGLNIWSYYGVPKPLPVKAIAAGVGIVAVIGIVAYALAKRRR